MDAFFESINDAREDALQRFGRDLPRTHQASAMCHLAETLMMFAENRRGKIMSARGSGKSTPT